MRMLGARGNEDSVAGIEVLDANGKLDAEAALNDVSDVPLFTAMRPHVLRILDQAQHPGTHTVDLMANPRQRRFPPE